MRDLTKFFNHLDDLLVFPVAMLVLRAHGLVNVPQDAVEVVSVHGHPMSMAVVGVGKVVL